MSLSQTIPAEISKDVFSSAIQEYCSRPDVFNILEIGSSSGDGSTLYAYRGITANPNKPRLFCLEVVKERFAELADRYKDHSHVVCLNMASVDPSEIERPESILEWYKKHTYFYRLEMILHWLDEGLRYLLDNNIPFSGIEFIRTNYGVKQFDVVILDGGEFNGRFELDHVYGAKYILMDDIRAVKNSLNYSRLLRDPVYRLVQSDTNLRWGFAIFERCPAPLPLDFFAGEWNSPALLVKQLEVLQSLEVSWRLHLLGASTRSDGTTNFSDAYSSLIRNVKPEFKECLLVHPSTPDGSPNRASLMNSLHPTGILWQLVEGESWTREQIENVGLLFLRNPLKTSAYFFRDIYQHGRLTTDSTAIFSSTTSQHCLRVWKTVSPLDWEASHSPDLAGREWDSFFPDMAGEDPFTAYDTAREHLIIKVELPPNAPNQPVSSSQAVHPVALAERFAAERSEVLANLETAWFGDDQRKIVIDAVIDQRASQSELSRLWHGLLKSWARTPLAKRLIIIDREGTARRVEGLTYAPLQKFDPARPDLDQRRIQGLCDFYGAILFLSTGDTFPKSCKFVSLVHNFWAGASSISFRDPESLSIGYVNSIRPSAALLCSANQFIVDLRNLHRAFHFSPSQSIRFGTDYSAKPLDQQMDFRHKYGLTRPFFLLCGMQEDSHHTSALIDALNQWKSPCEFDIVALESEPTVLKGLKEIRVLHLAFDDNDLQCAYSAAMAFLYPGHKMSVGMSITEAMRCQCPVIAGKANYLVEIGGVALLQYEDSQPKQILSALDQILAPDERAKLVRAAEAHVSTFTADRTAADVQQFVLDILQILYWEPVMRPGKELYFDDKFAQGMSNFDRLLQTPHFSVATAEKLADKLTAGHCLRVHRLAYAVLKLRKHRVQLSSQHEPR